MINRRKISWPADKPLKLTAPTPYIPKEHDEQVAIFEYAEIAAQQDDRWNLLFATLNGVRLPIGLAKKMKRAGNKQGVPDLCLPIAQGGYFGWWGEGKRVKGGVISRTQSDVMRHLEYEGYKVVVWRGAQDCIRLITEYLALPPTRRP